MAPKYFPAREFVLFLITLPKMILAFVDTVEMDFFCHRNKTEVELSEPYSIATTTYEFVLNVHTNATSLESITVQIVERMIKRTKRKSFVI